MSKNRNFLEFCPQKATSRQRGSRVGLSKTWVFEGELTLRFLSSIRIGFTVTEPYQNHWNLEGKKGMSIPGQRTASTFKSGSPQWNSKHSRSDNWNPFVSMSCAPSFGSSLFHISCVAYWLGVFRIQTKRSSKNYLFIQAAEVFRGDFSESGQLNLE